MKRKTIIGISSFAFLFSALFFTSDFAHASVSFNFMANRTITGFFQSILSHLQGVIAFLSVLFLVIAGVLYISSAGNSSLVTAAKMCMIGAIVGFALAMAGPSFLREIQIIIYGSPTTTIPTNLSAAPTIAEIVTRALSFLLSILGMLAIIGLTVSGIMYLAAAGGTTQAENAKKAMKYSIIGIAIAAGSLILVRQIALFF
ncbi:MAG: hypothetical protein U9O20_01440 [Patescibacteria group bacterium]|nr:hypothetical protein [Patescibacteria group bacterium]